MVDVLSRLLKQACALGLFEGIGHHKELGGILSLQLACDTLLFCVDKKDSMLVAKIILLAFEDVRVKNHFSQKLHSLFG